MAAESQQTINSEAKTEDLNSEAYIEQLMETELLRHTSKADYYIIVSSKFKRC